MASNIYPSFLLNSKRQQIKNIQKTKTYRDEEYPFMRELSRIYRNKCNWWERCTTVKEQSGVRKFSLVIRDFIIKAKMETFYKMHSV